MIELIENKSEKLPCITSLFLKLPFYDKSLFDTLIQSSNVLFNKNTQTLEIPINKLKFVLDLLLKYDDVKLVEYREENKNKVSVDISRFKVKPYSHQIEAIEYGLNANGWMLLDDCGLGKTMTMIYLAEELSRRENLEHCFIVCGVNGLKYNWASEIEKFSDKTYTILGQSYTKNGKSKICSVAERCNLIKEKMDEFFVITNIETLQSKEFEKAFNKSKNKFDMIVLDEAHHCKNPASLSGKNLLKLKAKRCIALTGTLIMNNPENSYVPLKWTGNTKSTFTEFKGMYNVYGGFGGVQVIGHKNLQLLQSLIENCSLRRLKSDVLDLPDKVYLKEYVEMSNEQRHLYDNVADGIASELDLLDHKPTIMEELSINTRLRQITAFPGIVSTETNKSAKLDRLEELAEIITSQGDKIVVFSTYKGTAYELKERLSKYNPVVCTGDQNDQEINYNKQIFESDKDCRIMICTWQKMGTGHTLTSANYAIFVDTPWTDADFQQCADRIYRIGQNKKVSIITLITKDSYDERVQEILDRKECLSGYLIDNKSAEKLNIFEE